MKATYIRAMAGFRGDARLYRVSPAMKFDSWDDSPAVEFDYAVVSAVVAYSGPETYIFGADEYGTILEWCELKGSFRGGLDHRAALKNAGYEVIE